MPERIPSFSVDGSPVLTQNDLDPTTVFRSDQPNSTTHPLTLSGSPAIDASNAGTVLDLSSDPSGTKSLWQHDDGLGGPTFQGISDPFGFVPFKLRNTTSGTDIFSVGQGGTVISNAGASFSGDVSLTGTLSSGSANVTNNLTAGSLTSNGALSANSATVTNGLSAGSATVSGGLTASGSVDTPTIRNSAGALTLDDPVTINGAVTLNGSNIGGVGQVNTNALSAAGAGTVTMNVPLAGNNQPATGFGPISGTQLQLNGTETRQWRHINKATTTAGQMMDFNNVVPSYDLYVAEVSLNIPVSTGASLFCRLNSANTSYSYIQRAGTAFTQVTSASQFNLAQANYSDSFSGLFYLFPGVSAGSNQIKARNMVSAAHEGHPEMERGTLRTNQSSVNRVRIWSGAETVGSIRLWGRNL